MRAPANLRAHLPWLLGALLVLGCGWIYREVSSFRFVDFDDDYNIVFNPHLGPLSWARVEWAFTDWAYMRRCVPLGWLGFSAVFGVSGLNPAGYHVAALGLHCLNALVVAAVLGRFATRELGADASPWRAFTVFMGAAFWAWHPLRVESVAWASSLLYEQATWWVLAALWCQLAEHRVAAVACHTLALLTYPIALGLAPLLVLLDARRDGWRRAFGRNAGHLAVALTVLAVTVFSRVAVTSAWSGAPALTDFPAGQRILQALYIWGHYLWRPWWPAGFTPVDPVLLNLAHPSWRVLSGATLVLALTAWLLVSRRARATGGWFFLAHLAVLVPVLGLMEKPHFPNDRYGFLSHLVLAAALVLLVARRQVRRLALAVVATGVLAFCVVVSGAQTEIWRDTNALWRHIVARLSPDDSPQLVYVRPALSSLRAGDTAAALARIDAGLRRRPDDALLLAARAEIQRIAAESRATAAALGLATPPSPEATLHFALALKLARAGETEAAAQHLAEVARIAPEYFARVTSRAPLPSAR